MYIALALEGKRGQTQQGSTEHEFNKGSFYRNTESEGDQQRLGSHLGVNNCRKLFPTLDQKWGAGEAVSSESVATRAIEEASLDRGHGGDRRASPAVRHLGWAKEPTGADGEKSQQNMGNYY